MRADPTTASWRLSQQIDLSGGRIAFDVFGDGPPVVLVHGTPSWSYLWRNVVPALAERFSVYVYDLLGYGDSPATDRADISVAGQGRLLADLLDGWELTKPALVGHDIGGAIALSAHLLHQRAVHRLALIDAVVFAPWITPTTRHIQRHMDAYRTMPVHIYEQIVTTHIHTAVAQPLSADTLAAYVGQWSGPAGQEAYLRKVAQFDESVSRQLEPRLSTMPTPTLVLWGEQDVWLKPDIARRLHATLPHSKLSIIPDAGHFSPEDAPGPTAAALLAFFAQ